MNGLTRHQMVRSAGLSALCAGVMMMGGGLLLATGASAQDPPGNNGTIKVDDQPFDSIPNNKPHVGCVFRVDFYGFDQDVGDATVTFEMQAPTKDVGLSVSGGDLTPDIGEDAAGGGTDVDAMEEYTLSFDGDPHPVQGFHVKLTIEAPGSIGAKVKHKVFWVQDCPAPPTETPPTETPPTETPPTETPPTETPPTDTPPTETTPPTPQPPATTPPPPPPTEVVGGVGGVDGDSGSVSWWPVGLIGSGGLLAGGGALALRRRGDHQV
jgi:hypothetical protein